MSVREVKAHLVIIDDSTVILVGNGHPEILNSKRAKHALGFLGLEKEPLLVPDRSFELAKQADQSSDPKPVRGASLELLSVLAEYKDPLTAAQIGELIPNINEKTVASAIFRLRGYGLVNANHMRPKLYMVTGKGHLMLKNMKLSEEAKES